MDATLYGVVIYFSVTASTCRNLWSKLAATAPNYAAANVMTDLTESGPVLSRAEFAGCMKETDSCLTP